jgi:hypothetical protein
MTTGCATLVQLSNSVRLAREPSQRINRLPVFARREKDESPARLEGGGGMPLLDSKQAHARFLAASANRPKMLAEVDGAFPATLSETRAAFGPGTTAVHLQSDDITVEKGQS